MPRVEPGWRTRWRRRPATNASSRPSRYTTASSLGSPRFWRAPGRACGSGAVRNVARRSRRLPKVAELCVERAPECWPGGAPLHIGGEAPVARHDVGVMEDAKHGRHHQIACGEAVAVEIGFVVQRLRQRPESVTYERFGTGAAKFCPLLIGVEQVNQRDVHHERLDGIEGRD